MHEFEKRSKIDGLEGQRVEDFGKVGQPITIESGLTKGFHAWCRKASGKWQSPMHAGRHYFDECDEYSPVGSLISLPLPIFHNDECDLE